MTGAAERANAASGVGTLATDGAMLLTGSWTGATALVSARGVSLAATGAAGSLVAGVGAGAAGEGVAAKGVANPINVWERSGLWRGTVAADSGAAGATEEGVAALAVGATDGVSEAAGGAEERDGSGAAIPMSVFERSGFEAWGRTLGVACAVATGGAEARAGAAGGGGAEVGTGGDGAGSAPQSVSMSSVEGGMEGGVGARGGWLEAGRGGTDDVRP